MRALIGAGGTRWRRCRSATASGCGWRRLRTAGRLLRDGAAGGAVHDLGRGRAGRYPAQRAARPLAASAAPPAGLL